MDVRASKTIPGLLQVSLTVHGDERGSFTEIYQAQKLRSAGLPDWFTPVQTNLSRNTQKGVTRGIHAEPWNKYITTINGKIFAAIVDLRPDNFGAVETFELELGDGLFVPKGCGNSYQTLTDNVAYLYHVDDHWRTGLSYPSINLYDEDLGINWPVTKAGAIISEKDLSNPKLSEVQPMEVDS